MRFHRVIAAAALCASGWATGAAAGNFIFERLEAFEQAPAVASFDLTYYAEPPGEWAPAPMAGFAAFETEVDGLGRRVRPEEPGLIGAALGRIKADLFYGDD